MAFLTAYSPIDRHPLGEYAIPDQDEVRRRLNLARAAQPAWAAISVQDRANRLSRLSPLLLAEIDRIVDIVVETTGKVRSEALLGEIYPLLAALDFYHRHATAILSPRSVFTSPFAFPDSTAVIDRIPFGAVAVISPWNFPLQLSLLPMLTALIAGNGVILKPSELTLRIGDLIADLLGRIDLPKDLVQIIPGAKETGEQLIDAAPDLIFFTGSVAGGRAIMERAARHPVPVVLELGGKDAMLVFDDAPRDRAVKAAAYGAFSNSGQVCVSVERCFVQRRLYPRFVDAVVAATASVNVGHGRVGDVGGMTSQGQIDIVKAHYDDALARGAKASGPLRREGAYLYPAVLWDVTPEMKVMREETFGPLLPIMPFADEEEALSLANASEFGLNASVWTRDLEKGRRVARQLQVGGWSVNDLIKSVGHPALPFGGVKRSGFGRYHGSEGLLAFTRPVGGLINDGSRANEPNWFPYSDQRYLELKGFLDCAFGKDRIIDRIRRNWPALQAFREYSGLHFRQRWENLKFLLPWNKGY